MNGRYFLFHVGMGFDAAVVAQVERRAGLKRYAGHPLFVYAGFDTWIRHYDRSRPRFSVRFADGTVVDDGYLSICLNTNPYTYLGNRPLNLAPEATLERGLAMVTLRTLAFARTMRIIGSALGNGQAPPHARAGPTTAPTSPGSRSPATDPFPYQVDGDHLGDTELLEISHEPDVLDLVHARLTSSLATSARRRSAAEGVRGRRRGRW